MKKFLYLLFATFVVAGVNACSPDDNEPNGPQTEEPTPNPEPDPNPTTGKKPYRVLQFHEQCPYHCQRLADAN